MQMQIFFTMLITLLFGVFKFLTTTTILKDLSSTKGNNKLKELILAVVLSIPLILKLSKNMTNQFYDKLLIDKGFGKRNIIYGILRTYLFIDINKTFLKKRKVLNLLNEPKNELIRIGLIINIYNNNKKLLIAKI